MEDRAYFYILVVDYYTTDIVIVKVLQEKLDEYDTPEDFIEEAGYNTNHSMWYVYDNEPNIKHIEI